MGKVSGFLEYTREVPDRRPPSRAHQRLVRDLQSISRGQDPPAGRALHGLRRSVLPYRMPGAEHHSRLERSGVARALARGEPRAALDQQFPGIHRAHLPRAVRSGVRARDQRAAGDDQEHREDHRRSRVGRRLDCSRIASRRGRASASQWWARGRPAWPRRSNWRAPGMP